MDITKAKLHFIYTLSQKIDDTVACVLKHLRTRVVKLYTGSVRKRLENTLWKWFWPLQTLILLIHYLTEYYSTALLWNVNKPTAQWDTLV